MKTKKPSAIIYGYHKEGEEILISDVYFQEGLEDEVVIYSLPYTDAVVEDYSKYKPDLIISVNQEISVPHEYLRNKHIHIGEVLPDNVLANIIVCQTVFRSCKVNRPKFSIFTPIYKTGERILRTYEGLKNQTLDNWEWVIVDDSPNGEIETWNILVDIAEKDYRVKLHDILPKSGGNIGLAKHRAAILCDGDWLIELDHDDCLTNECLMTCNDAIQKHPGAKFLYTNCAEIYDDGEPKYYDHDWSGDWYAREDNYFDFGYAGHTWVDVDGVKRLAHHYPDINPLTVRYNISMPNHARMWERNFYHEIGGHNKLTPVADDLEIIMRTFLNTRMIHVKKVLYLQYNNKNSTVDNNSNDINRRARLIRDYYDTAIHNRIEELGFHDWNWSEEDGHSQKFQNRCPIRKYYDEEQVMNYIYE
jgi:glycosyltransferase involved in cell wall biosynthesis